MYIYIHDSFWFTIYFSLYLLTSTSHVVSPYIQREYTGNEDWMRKKIRENRAVSIKLYVNTDKHTKHAYTHTYKNTHTHSIPRVGTVLVSRRTCLHFKLESTWWPHTQLHTFLHGFYTVHTVYVWIELESCFIFKVPSAARKKLHKDIIYTWASQAVPYYSIGCIYTCMCVL